jgi:hypothetical protein
MGLINGKGYTGILAVHDDQFAPLSMATAGKTRGLGIPLHPFLMGQPSRAHT